MSRVFGIGLSRTGTTSLTTAMNMLGYKFIHYPSKSILFNLKDNEGACDIPVVRYYKELDRKFPGSKFVYTVRDKKDWILSAKSHFKRRDSKNEGLTTHENRVAVYGVVDFDEEIFAKKYDAHELDVRRYFENRMQDLLIMDICNGDSWNKLLPFIDHRSNMNIEFPHSNKRKKDIK